jgi:hypothetical protein
LNWRAFGAGVGLTPVVIVWMAVTEPLLLPFVGVVPGLVAGYLAGSIRSGLLYGTLVGVSVVAGGWLLVFAGAASYRPEYVAPGFGMTLVVLLVFALLLGVEIVIGGVVGGALNR